MSHTRLQHSGRSQKTSNAKKHVAFACNADSFGDYDRRRCRTHAIAIRSQLCCDVDIFVLKISRNIPVGEWKHSILVNLFIAAHQFRTTLIVVTHNSHRQTVCRTQPTILSIEFSYRFRTHITGEMQTINETAEKRGTNLNSIQF